jgi:hypothetical protein
MSSSDVASLKFAAQQFSIYFGWSVFVAGLIGNILNIIIFTSLKTFRQTSCVFYLTVSSTVNRLQLFSSILCRVLASGYDIDFTTTSMVLCKIRIFVAYTSALIFLTCICFAAADQFASMTVRWRHLATRMMAHRLVTATLVIWCLHGIPILLFYVTYSPPSSHQPSCTITNTIFSIYTTYFIFAVLFGCIPISIQLFFGSLAYINAHSAVDRQVSIVRCRRDKQLTFMVSGCFPKSSKQNTYLYIVQVLIEIVIDIILRMPFLIYFIYSRNLISLDLISTTRSQVILSITVLCLYSSSTVS